MGLIKFIVVFFACGWLYMHVFLCYAQDSIFISKDDSSLFKFSKLNKKVNTRADEYWPSITADEERLFFTRKIGKGVFAQEDFYVSEKKDHRWQKAVPLFDINTDENEGAQCITADGRLMVFTACNRPGGFGSCDLYYTRKIGDHWLTPINMGEGINTKAWEVQPSLSTDGHLLYFVSNREGGKGKMDIWVTTLLGFDRTGGMIWSTPRNLNLNTEKNEMSPFIHASGRNLYFASDGYGGLGGLDLFVSQQQNDSTFSTPVNMGSPINTPADEMSLIVNISGNKAYFSSARGKNADKDIYSIQLPTEMKPIPVRYVKGKILNTKTLQPIFAQISLVNHKDIKDVQRFISDMKNGEYLLCIVEGEKYLMEVAAEGYMYYAQTISTEDTVSIKSPKNILLTPISVGKKVTLNHVYFDFDSYKLKPESIIELNNIVRFLSFHPSLKIMVAGHTDNIGTDRYNIKLSTQRAKSVYDYLVNHHIEPDRLKYKGFGKTQPIDRNDTQEAHSKNRRTEIIILK